MTAAYRHVRRHFDVLMGGGEITPIVSANFLTSTALPSWLTWTNPNGHRTMFDSTGKLTWAPNNLLLNSSDMTQRYSGATSAGSTATASYGSGPSGSMVSSRIEMTATGNYIYKRDQANSLPPGKYVASVYAKAGSAQTIVFRAAPQTGSAGDTACNLTTSWQRFSVVATITATGYIEVGFDNRSFFTGGDDAAKDFEMSGMVFELVTYETSARTWYAGYETGASAYYGPRFDYDPATLDPRGLLIEESRQNLFIRSNDWATAGGWSRDTSPATALQNLTGPDGVANSGWSLADTSNSDTGYYYQTVASLSNATQYTYSVWLKKTSGATIYPAISVLKSASTVRAGVNIGTNTQTLSNWTSYSGATLLTFSSKVVDQTTDWFRVSLTFTTDAAASYIFVVVPANRTSLDTVGEADVSAQGTVGFYGAQLELGSFATSYIPTTTAAVTRNAEKVTSTTTAMGYVAATGTLVVEAELPEANQIAWIAGFDTTGGANAIALYKSASGDITTAGGEAAAYEAGATTLDLNGTLNSGDPFRVGLRYNTAGGASGFSASLNGGAIVSGTVRTPSPTAFGLGYRIGDAQWINGHIRHLAYYNKALSDAAFISATSLGGPTTGFLLEDGTSFLLLENGDYLVQE